MGRSWDKEGRARIDSLYVNELLPVGHPVQINRGMLYIWPQRWVHSVRIVESRTGEIPISLELRIRLHNPSCGSHLPEVVAEEKVTPLRKRQDKQLGRVYGMVLHPFRSLVTDFLDRGLSGNLALAFDEFVQKRGGGGGARGERREEEKFREEL